MQHLDQAIMRTIRSMGPELSLTEIVVIRNISRQSVEKALTRLMVDEYVSYNGTHYCLTCTGEALLCEEDRDPRLRLNTEEWEMEALTGMAPDGSQSTITRAVLPLSGHSVMECSTENEDMIDYIYTLLASYDRG